MTRDDTTPLSDLFPDDRTTALPTEPGPGAQGTTAQGATASGPAPDRGTTDDDGTTRSPVAPGPWLPGPAPFALVLGILGLVVAAGVLLADLTDLSVPWGDLGPWSVVAAGAVVVLVGAIGLRASSRRQG